jgi:hypothetical protein
MRSLWRLLTSPRSTIAVFAVLAVLLLLNIVLPQEAVVGPEGSEEAAASGAVAYILLETLGLGSLSTSPVFLGSLSLFFLNLISVLVDRFRTTLRRTRLVPPSSQTLDGWCRRTTSLHGSRTSGLNVGTVYKALGGLGYRAVKVADGSVWAIKHRTAPLGFLVFHLSFFLLCAGGVILYLTRFVGTSVLVEGQEFSGFTTVLREAPMLAPPQLRFSLLEVDGWFEAGQALKLGAVFRFEDGIEEQSRINHPARTGATKILVNRAGVAPVLWLQDVQGFTRDRVAVAAATLGGETTVVDLADGAIRVTVRPGGERRHFPRRDELEATEIWLSVTADDTGPPLFEGTVGVGQAVNLPGAALLIPELRYWVGVYVVREHGGVLLVVGFAMGILGLVWRLLLFRREVAVVWQERDFSVAGKAEYFSHRFQMEVETLVSILEGEVLGTVGMSKRQTG